MRILVAGDVHRKAAWFEELCHIARREAADVILQVGDLGYWEHRPIGVRFLDDVEELLRALGRPCVWIDGNHENHDLLRSRYQPADDGFVEIRERLLYAPRGHRWTWDGVDFLALGGAPSFDRWLRTPGESWWADETITEAEAEVAMAGGPVDVVVAHDCPAGLFPPPGIDDGDDTGRPARSPIQARRARMAEGFRRAQEHRETVRRVVDGVRPHLVLHGHYHHRHTSRLVLDDGWAVRIEGLGRDNQGDDAWLLLDTATLRARR